MHEEIHCFVTQVVAEGVRSTSLVCYLSLYGGQAPKNTCWQNGAIIRQWTRGNGAFAKAEGTQILIPLEPSGPSVPVSLGCYVFGLVGFRLVCSREARLDLGMNLRLKWVLEHVSTYTGTADVEHPKWKLSRAGKNRTKSKWRGMIDFRWIFYEMILHEDLGSLPRWIDVAWSSPR